MLGEIFGKILDMGIVGGYVILIAIFLRLLLYRCERKYSYYLWLLVFVSLCVPLRPQGNFSLIPHQLAGFSIQEQVARLFGETISGQRFKDNQLQDAMPALDQTDLKPAGVLTQEGADSEVSKELIEGTANREGQDKSARHELKSTSEKLMFTAGVVWMAGIVLIAVFQMFNVLRFGRQLGCYSSEKKPGKAAYDKYGEIRECKWVEAPFLWGFFHPVIYIPAGLEEQERSYILAHERYHRKRKDNFTKLFAFCVTVVYWFHPLVWAAYILFCRDMELSCDEAVLLGAEQNIRREYASSLLRFAAKQNGYSFVLLSFGESFVKSRIRNVLTFRKNKAVVSVMIIALLAAVALGIFLWPDSDKGEGNNTMPDNQDNINPQQNQPGQGEEPLTDQVESVSHAAIGENYLGSFGKEQYYWEELEDGKWQVYSVNEENGERLETLFSQTVENGTIHSFGADEKNIVYSAGEVEGSLGLFSGAFYSYNRQTQRVKEAYVTDAADFIIIDDYIYYQKYMNQGEDDTNDLYRMNLAFAQEERIAQNTRLVGYDIQGGRLYGARRVNDRNYLADLISMNYDGSDSIVLINMADGYFADRMEDYDSLEFQNITTGQDDFVSVEVWQWGYREGSGDGYRNSLIEKRFYRVKTDGSMLSESAIEEDSVSLRVGGNETGETLDGVEETFRPAVSITAESVDVFLVNNTGQELMAGEDYYIQIWEDGKWSDIPNNNGWHDIGIIIGPESTCQFQCMLDHSAYEYKPGTYRIKKSVYLDEEKKDLYAEFDIVI